MQTKLFSLKLGRRAWPGAAFCCEGAYALLLAAAIWKLVGSGLTFTRVGAQDKELDAAASQLDCFSRPGVAAAVLREEGERLLFAYTHQRDAQSHSEEGSPSQPGAPKVNPELAQRVSPRQSGLPPAVSPMEGLREEVQSLELDLNRKQLVTSGSDSKARLWDLEPRPPRELVSFGRALNSYWSFAVSPDGQRIAAGTWEGLIFAVRVDFRGWGKWGWVRGWGEAGRHVSLGNQHCSPADLKLPS
jgi:hypothetical protein